jgi:RNA polymerase sigma factor (sigma-70 family)
MVSEKDYKAAVQEYTKNLYRYLFKTLRDDAAAKDLVQDCFLKLWNHKENIDPLKIKSWLFSVAHNGMLNYLKSQSRKARIENQDTASLPFVFQHDFELKEIIDLSLNELEPLQKSIILLRDLEGYNYLEIGEMLDLNESQVKVYLFRARQKMKNIIQHFTVSYDRSK